MLIKINFKLLAFSSLALTVLTSNDAMSFEIERNFHLPNVIEFDTNVNMSVTNKKKVFRFISTPKVSISGFDELNSFNLNGALNIVRSTNDQYVIDREDPNIGFGFIRQFEKGDVSFGSNYIRQSIRTSEFANSGVIFRDGSSIDRNANLTGRYYINDLLTVSGRAVFNNQKYNNVANVGLIGNDLFGYKTTGYGLGLEYNYSENLKTFINYDLLKYTSEQPLNNYRSNTTMAGVNYAYSPLLNLMFSAGTIDIDSASLSWLANTSFDYALSEYINLEGGYQRSNSPSGLGGAVTSDNVYILANIHQSDRDNIDIRYNWNSNKNINIFESTSFQLIFSRLINANWTGSFTMARRTIDGNNVESTGQQIGFNLTYNLLNF